MYTFKTSLDIKNILKYKDNKVAKCFLDYIDELCDRFRNTPIEVYTFEEYRLFDTTGDRATFERKYFDNRHRLTAFFLRTVLYGEEADINELNEIVWAVTNEFAWSLPAHTPDLYNGSAISHNSVDLFASETAATLAEIIALAGDYIHPYLKKRVIENIEWRVIKPFETQNREKYRLWWLEATNNWAAVCGGAVGIAALYLVEDEKRLKNITDICSKTVNRYIDSCTDDGVCLEGINYWNYAMQFYVAYDELLRERLGVTCVESDEKLHNVSEFPSVACLTNDIGIQFSDASGEPLTRCGTMMKLHERYGVPMPYSMLLREEMDNCARTADAVRSLAWFNAEYVVDEVARNDVFKPDAQWAKKYKSNSVLAIKGGHNDEPHNHNDIGSYMYIKNNVIVAHDFGAPVYDKGFFSEKRYEYINASSAGHSVPIINGVLQHEGREFSADSFKQIDGGIEVSLAGAYSLDCGAKTVIRRATLDDNGTLSITDQFTFEEAGNTVNDRVVVDKPVVIEGNKVKIMQDDKVVGTITIKGNAKLSVTEDKYLDHHSNVGDACYVYIYLINIEYETEADTLECGYTIE